MGKKLFSKMLNMLYIMLSLQFVDRVRLNQFILILIQKHTKDKNFEMCT